MAFDEGRHAQRIGRACDLQRGTHAGLVGLGLVLADLPLALHVHDAEFDADDQAQQALQLTRDVVREFVEKGPSPQELRAAQDNLVGGFALRLDSNKKLLDNLANIAWYELPLDYLDTWTQRVAAVTLQDIVQAFRRKIQPDRMVTLVLGPQ